LDEIEAQPPTKTNRKAITSLVLGFLGLTGVLFVAAIVAIVIGRRAHQEIDATGQPGRSLATIGIVLGWTGLIWITAFIIFFWVFADTVRGLG
jgi:hypothetical protein